MIVAKIKDRNKIMQTPKCYYPSTVHLILGNPKPYISLHIRRYKNYIPYLRNPHYMWGLSAWDAMTDGLRDHGREFASLIWQFPRKRVLFLGGPHKQEYVGSVRVLANDHITPAPPFVALYMPY